MAKAQAYRLLSRFLVFALILGLAVPLPLAASARARGEAAGYDFGKARVLQCLNSPERAAAIEKMNREESLRGERRENDFPASPPSNSPLSTPQLRGE